MRVFMQIAKATCLFVALTPNVFADANDVARINREVAAYKKQQALDNAVMERRVVSGMTESQVMQAKGSPSRINNNGGSVQWVYDKGSLGDDYVYFQNGVVR
jgi:hypothetical protein